jgi:hypothetical protein
MNLENREKSRILISIHGLDVRKNFSAPGRGGVFFLDIPSYRTCYMGPAGALMGQTRFSVGTGTKVSIYFVNGELALGNDTHVKWSNKLRQYGSVIVPTARYLPL